MFENLNNAMFVLSFIAMFVIIAMKFFNVMTYRSAQAKIIRDARRDIGQNVPFFPYNLNMTWLLLFIFVICWGITFMVFMVEPLQTMFMLGFGISRFFLLLVILFTIIEVIFHIEKEATKPINQLGFND